MKIIEEVGPLRVPIVAAVVLLYLPLGALLPHLPGSSLVRSLFDLSALTPASGLGWTLRTFVTFSFAWLALGIATVALHQSASIIHDFFPSRLGRPQAGRRRPWAGPPSLVRGLILATPALLSVAASLSASLDGRRPPYLGVLLAATAAGLVVYGALRAVMRWCASFDPVQLRAVAATLERFAARFETSGYTARDDAVPDDPLLHHVWAALFFLFSGAVLAIVGLWALTPAIQDSLRIPALCSIYLLIMVATWGLSALTFFFDYYRIPILTLLLLPVLLAGFSSYLYDVHPRSAGGVLLPREVVAQRLHGQPGRIVAIAAAGGGIQAAAWTARVLEGLQEVAGTERDAFVQRIAVLSGVSGGSVGIAPFVLSLLPPVKGKPAPTLEQLFVAASASSLDPVAATWVTLDLLPFRLGPDRGRALQNAWRASWAGVGLASDVTLGTLAAGATHGALPAVMFNATSMTTGERLILGTTVPTRPLSAAASVLQAAVVRRLPGEALRSPEYEATTVVADIDLATAVRLSATFPLVSPAARCRDCKDEEQRQYVVDGGYVDSTGMQSLGEWVEQLLSDDQLPAAKVSIVQIVPFTDNDCGESDPLAKLPPSQLAVPLSTLFNVRGPGQDRSALTRLVNLQRRFGDRVCVHTFVYSSCQDEHGFAPPLSWHLTPGESEQVAAAWDDGEQAEAARVVREVLGPGDGCVASSIAAPRSERAR